jgi:hypothetical protein
MLSMMLDRHHDSKQAVQNRPETGENPEKTASKTGKIIEIRRNGKRSRSIARTLLSTVHPAAKRRKKTPRHGGAGESRRGSGRLRNAAHFGDRGFAVQVFVEDFACIADTFAAHGTDAQFLVQFGYGRDAKVDRLADFAVRNVVADTDDHRFGSLPLSSHE